MVFRPPLPSLSVMDVPLLAESATLQNSHDDREPQWDDAISHMVGRRRTTQGTDCSRVMERVCSERLKSRTEEEVCGVRS